MTKTDILRQNLKVYLESHTYRDAVKATGINIASLHRFVKSDDKGITYESGKKLERLLQI